MTNPIKQFIIHWKVKGLKQTLKDWKRNFLLLQTPELINKQKIQGNIGMLLGLILIFIIFILNKSYYLLIAIGAGIFLNYIQLKQLYSEKQVLNDLENQFVEVKE